ncbi:MAG: MBL fold metallo-hydrolase, partial [Alphaproteobacteria bacterium]
ADDPTGPVGLDHVILESTYGATARVPLDSKARRTILANELKAAHAAGGPLLIPAFAVERTQELLVDLLDLMETTEAPPGPIFVDSPLAIKACDIFLRRGHLESGENPFRSLRESRLLQFTESYSESRDLARLKGWHVIVAASGMCDAGRVRGHLRRLLPREDATVMIVGYQAVGTLGRLLVEGTRSVRIQGDDVAVRARIRNIDIYSGHADAAALNRWIDARAPIAGTVFLDHGEPASLSALQTRLSSAGLAQNQVVIAALDQTYRLTHGAKADVLPTAPSRVPANALARLDWHNARAAFLTRLQERLETMPDDAKREALLAKLEVGLSRSAAFS